MNIINRNIAPLLHNEETKYIEQAVKGDNKAFEYLVKKYEQRIYDLAFKILNNSDEASDVLQETFLQAYRALLKFRSQSSFSTWLYRIAMNNCLMKIRKQKLQNTESLDNDVNNDGEYIRPHTIQDWSFNPEATAENTELKEVLTKTISALAPDYRTVLILHDMQGLSNREVSNILKVSLSAMKSRLHRARNYVRQQLTEYFMNKNVLAAKH